MRVHGDLAEVAGRSHGAVVCRTPRSAKDAVEAAGVPHPEIGRLLVDGVTVGFAHRLTGGERVDVHPPVRPGEPGADPLWPVPPEPRRFVLDVHLGTLARRLRLLGFDAWWRADADDARLAELAVAETRVLLTRDRGLLKRAAIVHGYCPRSDDPDEQALEVTRRYGLAARSAPLTRCVKCNGRLYGVARADVCDEVPPRSREAFTSFARCAACRQVYWPGSHLAAVDGFLDRVAGTASGGAAPEPS